MQPRTSRLALVIAATSLVLGGCGKKTGGPSLSAFVKTHAAKIDALRSNLRRAVTAAAAPAAASAPKDCSALHLALNGKPQAGNAEVLWFDEAEDVLAGKLPTAADDRHLVPRFVVAGWCQLLDTSMYWLDGDTPGARALEKSGVGGKVAGWIESALNLSYAIVLVPGDHARGEQKVELRAVELATGTVKCSVEVTGRADPSLGVQYYQIYKNGQKRGIEKRDRYAEGMKADLQAKLQDGLSKGMGVDMRAFCAHPD